MSLEPKRRGALALLLLLWPGAAGAASPSLDDCDVQLEADPQAREGWACYYDAARAGADWDAAEQRVRAAIERHAGTHGYDLAVLANLVAPHDPNQAIELYERALALHVERGDHLPTMITALNLAHRYRVVGQPERAAAALTRAETAAERLGEPKWVATTKLERVRHTLRTGGDLGEALRLLEEIEPSLFPDGDPQARLNWLNAAGSVNAQLGREVRAEALHERLIAEAQAAGDTFVEATARYNKTIRAIGRARAAGERANTPKILHELEQIIAIARDGENRALEVAASCALADLRDDESMLRECLGSARALGDPRILAEALVGLAWSVVIGEAPSPEREAEAIAAIDEVLELAHRSGDGLEQVNALDSKAELLWWLGRESAARSASEAALAEIEALRSEQGDAEGRAAIENQWAYVYERTIGHLLGGSRARGREHVPSAGDLAAAFAVSERLRAQLLLEALGDAGIDRAPLHEGPEYREVLDAIASTQVRLSDPELSAGDRAELIAELEVLERREQGLRAREARLGSSSVPAVTLAEAQAALASDEALLIYQLANTSVAPGEFEGGSWVMIVTREQLRVHRLADERELLPRLELFGPLLARRDGGELEASAKLWSLLLDDPLAGLPAGVEHLIIVPDGALHRLAFAALRPEPDAASLIERYAISFAPSASSLSLWRRDRAERGGPPGEVLALADPPIAATAAQLYASVIVSTQRGASVVEGLRLSPLPRARLEAERAVTRDGELWLGERAGEAALRSIELDRFGVLHFATHALVDELHPNRSAIVLARDAEHHDGFLQPREIVELELDGKLVILSACSSASGAVVEGEGVMGLGHAVFRGGAHALIGSLWPIRDDDALALIERLYVHLEAGRSVAEALAAAQRDRMAAGAPAAAWAGVVVLGDGALTLDIAARERDEPAGRSSPRWPALLLAGLVGLAGVFAIWRRR